MENIDCQDLVEILKTIALLFGHTGDYYCQLSGSSI